FLDRPNRFLIRCRLEGGIIRAFLPNPGRLHELLLPGTTVYVIRERPSPTRKNLFTAVAVEREGSPVFLHTHRTNEVAADLINRGKIPGWPEARVLAREIRIGHSRFDLLVAHQKKEWLVEVKSCTLFGEKTAMFPDAVTERGARHLRELAELARAGQRTAALFIIHWPRAEYFLPDYHTDLHFAQTLLAVREQVEIVPLAVEWKADLSLGERVRRIQIPWEVIEREAQDRGSYLLILRLKRAQTLEYGRRENRQTFPVGYYVYVGSAMKNLTQRLERHRRLRKNKFWHIDYLREVAEFRAALPIRASANLECAVAARMRTVADWAIPGFGASDCGCPGHLFGMRDNPLHSKDFMDLLQFFRMDRLFD
ncbi:MAG: DNA/RNA nuclease SfsA, partial [Deltaproteobacteria bacterium]|nr:DNA/RNA nuclease SfsA [Deltaproteobacteria bacterium]